MLYECRAEDTKTRGKGKDDGPVFYNKVQVFNRDVSVLVMALFAQWRYIEKRERQAGADARKAGGDGAAAAEAERARLYALSAAELDELLREDAATGGLRVLDALAATGLRSVRYAKEVPGVKKSCRTTSRPRPPRNVKRTRRQWLRIISRGGLRRRRRAHDQ